MAKLNTCFVLLAFTIIAASLFADNASADCDNDWTQLRDKCTAFAKKGIEPALPSDDCCQTIAQADLVCACSKVTSDTENNISVPLAIMVASFCRHPLPHGTHCGSVEVPKTCIMGESYNKVSDEINTKNKVWSCKRYWNYLMYYTGIT